MLILSPFFRAIRARPFSIMALCNIAGDLGYLGYAFAAQGFVSWPKLAGASFTMLAHILLLAYGDDQARVIAAEKGRLADIFLALRMRAQRAVALFPAPLQQKVRANPVGIPFAMLTLNGIALIADGVIANGWHGAFVTGTQIIMGGLIFLGCGAFALAGFTRDQRRADFLTRLAPSLLLGASVANIGLLASTLNPFIALSSTAFLVSNIAGFFVKLNKEKTQHLHS